MDVKQLTAVVTVAEVGSVTRAARLLHLVQPAVTRQIRALEQELGVALFQRTRQGMTLTPAGEVLLGRARRALLELERARVELAPPQGQVAGIVTVGVLESLADLVAPALVSIVNTKHPAVQLRILTGFSGYLQTWLDDGVVDLALVYNLAETHALTVTPLLSERLWAVAPPDAGLRPEESISWTRLLAEPLALPIVGHGLRTLIDRARAEIDVEPTLVIETNSMSVQKQVVQAGRAWTVLPASGIAHAVEAGQFSGAPLCDPEIRRSVAVGVRRAPRIPPAVEAVAVELTNHVRRMAASGEWPSATLDEQSHT